MLALGNILDPVGASPVETVFVYKVSVELTLFPCVAEMCVCVCRALCEPAAVLTV